MIYFSSANHLLKSLVALQPKRQDLPAGHAYAHTRIRMLSDECAELCACAPNRYAVTLYNTEAAGEAGLEWLVAREFQSQVGRMPISKSLTLQQHPNGLNLRSNLRVLSNGREAQDGNRIIGLYPDDHNHFELPEPPEQDVATVAGEALAQGIRRLFKFCQFGNDESRPASLVLEAGRLKLIGNAKESGVCYVQQTLEADTAQEGNWLFPGTYLSYVAAICEGPVEISASDDEYCPSLSFASEKGEVILFCRETDEVMLRHHHLFDEQSTDAPFFVGRRNCRLEELAAAVKMQAPVMSDPDSHLLDLVLHPNRYGLYLYRPGRHDQYSVMAVTALSEDEMLLDLATEFIPKRLNSSALKAAVESLKTYKAMVNELPIDGSVVRLRQSYTQTAHSQKRYQVFLEPALHPQPDLRIAIVCGELDELIDLEEEDEL